MPSWLLETASETGIVYAAGVTRYDPVCSIVGASLEGRVIWTARDTYTLADLYVRVTANATTASSTVRSRKNTANGNQSVSIGAAATGVFQDSVNTDAIVSGNTLASQTVVGAGGSLTITIIGYSLATAANNTPIFGTFGYATAGASFTAYFALMGIPYLLASLAEARSQYTFRTASTLSNMMFYLETNTRSDASTFRTRINGGNGSQVVSVAAGATGTFEDAVNTDSVVAGNTVNYQVVTGAGTGALVFYNFYMKSTSTVRQTASARAYVTALGSGLTRYKAIEGSSQDFATVEANTQIATPFAFTAQNGFLNLPTNNVNGTSTFTLQKNGVASAISMSVGASATGIFEDADTVSFSATDTVGWTIVTGGSSGSLQITVLGFELAQPAAAGNPWWLYAMQRRQ